MLDEIDIKILQKLQKDGRKTASKIADELNLTVPTITERIRKLQKEKIIKSFQAIVDSKLVGLDVSAVITVISSSSNHYREVIDRAVDCKDVVQCYSTTGMGSLLLFVSTKNSLFLEELLREIQSWPGVTRTETQVILSSYKDLFELPIK